MEQYSSTPGTQKPTQFTIRGLLVVTAVIAALLATATQFGIAGVPIFTFVATMVTILWASVANRPLLAAIGGLILLGEALLVCLLPVRSHAGPAAYRNQCSNHLKQIGLALLNYHERYGRFPPAVVQDSDGKPMHSWRVLILPYMEETQLYRQYSFSEPWNGPNNSKLKNAISYSPLICSSSNSSHGLTDYVAVVGPGTAWENPKGMSQDEIHDGTQNTILLVEIANSNINWMEPRDLDIRTMKMQVNPKSGTGPSSGHAGGVNVLFADGSVRFIPNRIDPKDLGALLTRNGGEKVKASKW